MKWLFWLVAVFAAAVALVMIGRMDPGYVLFVYPPYRVEASLLLFAIALAVGFVALYALVRLTGHTLSVPAYVRAYRARRRRERAHAALAGGLQAYYEGRYPRAEKEAAVAFQSGPSPALAALLAARACHEMREFQRRDEWLERADAAGQRMRAACVVTRAELALEDRDFTAARNALRELPAAAAKHSAPAHMLLRAERGAGAWEQVLRLADDLGKRDALAPAAAEEYKVQALVELLAGAASQAEDFERRWKSIDSRDRLHPRVAAAGARHATELGKAELARGIIERSLAAEWTPQLVTLYGELPPALDDAARAAEARLRIERGERWLRERSRDAQLLAALGRLCTQAELWGKARSFFEASLAFEESRASHLELARLAERLELPAEAQEHYRRAAELA
jgi:HemY protein